MPDSHLLDPFERIDFGLDFLPVQLLGETALDKAS
jgi:hypothetical protein